MLNLTYLYVEDDPLSRQVMQMLVEMGLGAKNLILFEDSSDFLARLQALSKKPDIFMLDIHVKPYDGFQMLEMIRSCPAYASTPVIALTASVMSEEVARLRECGFNGAIAKPLSLKTFPQLLERAVKGEHVWHIA